MTHLGQQLDAACARFADRLALSDADEHVGHKALAAIAADVAKRLRALSIASDEPVLLAVSNRARDLAGFFGIWLAGGVAVPVHRTTVDGAANVLLERTQARLVVNLRRDLPAPTALRGELPVHANGGPPTPSRPLLRDAALIVFTSGSTGEPKGAVIAHAGMSAKLDMIDAMLKFGADEQTLLVLQLTFSFGQWVSLLTLLRGGTLHLRATFESAAVLADLTRRPITRIAVVPTMLRALLPQIEAGRSRRFTGTVMAGGELLPAALGRRIRAGWPDARLWDIFGLTETGTCDFFLPADEYDDGAGSIGRPGPGIDYRLSEPEGELQIRTPTAMLGYLDQPELTAAAFADGWFRTGDLARHRDDGRVELIGRTKELIVRAGNKISPLEVERVFAEHPGIAAVLVTGAADEQRGEAIHLFVVPRTEAKLDAAGLLAWARDRLDRYKQPDHIHFGKELPLGRTGKADRGALRKLVEQPVE